MKKLSILFICTLLFASCKKSEATSSQPALRANYNSCIIGKWSPSSLPLNLKMSTSFHDELLYIDKIGDLNVMEQMAKIWNDTVESKTLIKVPFSPTAVDGYASTSSFRDGEIGIYKSVNWFSNVSANALAITQFYGVITQAPGIGTYIQLSHGDIIVNYRDYGSQLKMANASSANYDVPTIILHEMGHLLGLCHEEKEPSIMAPYYLRKQHQLQQYDKDIMANLYEGSSSAYNVKQNTNKHALALPPGTEVSGMIELRDDGKCLHYMNGEKTYEHIVEKFVKKK